MTNSRQRMLDTFNYTNPDRIPVVYHPSRAGLYVHGQKLIDLFNSYPPDNPIRFDTIPFPASNAFEANGDYHEIIVDEWGTGWEYRIFGIAGHPKTYPFASWKEGHDIYKFPEVPVINSTTFNDDKRTTLINKEKYLIFNCWISIFERLHALRPIDEMLMDLLIGEENALAFINRLVDYWMKVIDYNIAIGTDVFVFGDDWGSQSSTLTSPELFREIFTPLYQKLFKKIIDAGCLVFLHCCGHMGELLDDFIELGIRGLWPQIKLYEHDESFIKKCRDNKIAVYIHPDRQQLIPLGTPQQISDYIKQTAAKYKKLGGGGIFYVEIENDAPFENVKALIESIHKYR